jgi:hypothetical protein
MVDAPQQKANATQMSFSSITPQHDVACYHLKPFVCEDSDELLNFVRSRNPGLKL